MEWRSLFIAWMEISSKHSAEGKADAARGGVVAKKCLARAVPARLRCTTVPLRLIVSLNGKR
jgi:hypothetical protein